MFVCRGMTVSVSLLLMVRLICARARFTSFTASATCLLRFIALGTIITMFFLSCTFSRIFPSIIYSFILFILHTCSNFHFAKLNSIIHCFAHSVHLYIFLQLHSSLVTSSYNLVSSANLSTLLCTPSSRSLMNIRKRVGPRTDPCGTPFETSVQSEYLPLITTLCFLPSSHSWIHPFTTGIPSTPIAAILPINLWWRLDEIQINSITFFHSSYYEQDPLSRTGRRRRKVRIIVKTFPVFDRTLLRWYIAEVHT